MQKNRGEGGSMWILGSGSWRVMGLSDSQMQVSIIILTNESGTSIVQIPSVTTVKLELTDDSVLVLSDSEDDICVAVNISDRSRDFTISKSLWIFPNILTVLCIWRWHTMVQYHNVLRYIIFLHWWVWILIVDALKQTKSRKRSESNLESIDFNSIEVRDLKYLPSSFDGDILFVLPSVSFGVPSAYGRSMDGMDKMCDRYLWCTAKTTNTQNDFGLTFRRSTCACHFQCSNDFCDYMHRNASERNNTEWVGSTPTPFSMGIVAPRRSKLECNTCMHSFMPCLYNMCTPHPLK